MTATAATTAYGVTGVSAGYGPSAIVQDVSLQLRPGELTGLLGRNGAGKTTLVRVLAGLMAPSAGRAELDGRDLAAWDRREIARRVAVVPQETEEAIPFRVGEVVLMGRAPRHGRWGFDTADDVAATERAMELAGVRHLAARYPDQLSGGEWQRVRIARALAQEPQWLLLDEPTAHLDLHHRWRLYDLLDDLRRDRGCGVLVVTHDLHPLLERADRVVLLAGGGVTADGAPAQVATPAQLAAAFDVPAAAIPRGAAPATETDHPTEPKRKE